VTLVEAREQERAREIEYAQAAQLPAHLLVPEPGILFAGLR